jgi:hypothetical protein
MLGYYPDREPDGKYHEIKVKVSRSGVSLRFRRGYYAHREEQSTEAAVKADIRQVMWSPLESTAVAINARVDLNTKTNQLELIVQVDPSTITLAQRGDRWAGRLDMGFTQKDEEGKMYASISEEITLNLLKASYLKLSENGLMYRKKLDRHASAKYLRIVARDGASGLTGSLTVPLKDVKPFTPPVDGNSRQK